MEDKRKKIVAIVVSALVSLAISAAAGILGVSESEVINGAQTESCVVQTVI